MKQYNVLVLGGNGKTGRKVAQKLTELGQSVRIGSRSASPAFDWEDPKTWDAALEGMDRMYITFQPDLAVPGALDAIKSLVAKAKEKGMQKVVLLSGKGEREAELSEQAVADSGIDYTVVRASWFNQNFSESFFLDPIMAGHVALPHADAKVPFVDTEDIADVVVVSLLEEKHNGQIYEVTGPRYLTFEEVTREIAEATGRTIQFQAITQEQYIAMLREFQVPEDYLWLIDYLFTNVLSNPENQMISEDVEKVLGRKAKDFSEFVAETVKTGVWNP